MRTVAALRSRTARRLAVTFGGASLFGGLCAVPAQAAAGDSTTTGLTAVAAVGLAAAAWKALPSGLQMEDGKNSAFVFIKPHAATEPTKALVESELQAKGFKILTQGTLTGDTIDSNQYIDQHYYSIASKATLLEPSQLNVPADKFKGQFNIGWQEALDKGLVYNAKQAKEKLGITDDELDALWAKSKKAGTMIKFGGGFYCGLVEGMYVFNGFFMSMRSKYTGSAKIHYYVVEWSQMETSWGDFREKVLGPTDPASAPADSLRGKIAAQWKSLGLAAECDVGDNGVHASASPFEALAERTNWLEMSIESDAFGRALLAAGIPEATIKEWSVDPQVSFEGKKQSLFDLLEDLDSAACIAKCVEIAKAQ